MPFADGTYYRLPEGYTWEKATASRLKWGTDPRFAPLALGPGCVAWGTLLASNYRNALGEG